MRSDDGRSVSVLDVGPKGDTAVVYCHGTPGSRLDVAVLEESIARSGLRVIALDRPGFGHTDPMPNPSISAWCLSDLRCVLLQLGIARAAVVGYSLGALYALAAASSLPHVVRHVALVSPLPPCWNWPLRRVYAWAPVPRVIDAVVGGYVRRRPSAGVRRLRSAVSPSDRSILDRREVASAVEQTYSEMLRQGSVGWATDDWLAAQWRPDLSAIVTPVNVWRGAEDRLVPRHAVDELVADLPTAQLRLVDGTGHLIAIDHATSLLRSLTEALHPYQENP